jgi:hypothetical protein
LGSNINGHWVEESVAPLAHVVAWSTNELQKRMDRGGEGSMITTSGHYPLIIGSKRF